MMKVPSLVITGLAVVALASCGTDSTSSLVCPEYPFPALSVTEAVQGLQSPEVDQWMVRQMKLAQQLEACKSLSQLP